MTAYAIAGIALLLFLGFWSLLHPPRRFRFRAAARDTAWNRLAQALWRGLVDRLGARTLHQLQALGWPPWQAVAFTGVLALMLTLATSLALHGLAWLLLPIWLLLAWKGTGLYISRYYARWQRRMVAGLPRCCLLLRVHLDLGRTVPDALQAALPYLGPPLRQEMDRTVAEMRVAAAAGQRAPAALPALAARVDQMEFRVVADTLQELWGARLSGEALAPLEDLMAVTRARAAQEQADNLDIVLTLAPGLGLLGIAVWLIAGWLLASLHGVTLG